MPLQATSGAASYDAFGGGVAAAPKYIEDYFSTFLYQGTGASNTINNGIDLSTKGGLVWIKQRNQATSHRLFDTARGVQNSLVSNSTAATASFSGYLTAFNTNGFTVGSANDVNESGFPLTSWSFAKAPKFFDVVTYTGAGGNTRDIAHNLGSTPGFIIVKSTSLTSGWYCWHNSFAANGYVMLNSTAAATTGSVVFGGSGNKAPTSTTFTVGNNSVVNGAGETYVAYLFAHNAGGFGLTGTDNVISCGSYTASGTSATITLGYEPQWVLIKKYSAAGDNWRLLDTMRGMTVEGSTKYTLAPNTSAAEESWSDAASPSATGFTVNGAGLNDGGDSYIYIAIRRGPMKVPTSGTSVYNAISRTGTGATANVTGVGFPPDMLLDTMRSTNWTRSMWDRLRGPNLRVATNQTSAENSYTDAVMSYNQDGVTLGADGNFDVNASGYTYINWFFRRAPSFFDEVCYTGTGSATTFSHNLGVVPELMIFKDRTVGEDWTIYSQTLATNQALKFTTAAREQLANYWNTTRPTSSVFSVGDYAGVNSSGDKYVAYLFATCAGVSKVGSYTGTGTTKQVDCGFTGGARFVLIKRTDSTGDWYVWDSARGIVSGNDPYLLLNSTAAEVTSTDYVDTYSAGFEISSTAPAAINASGGTFIFLAIA